MSQIRPITDLYNANEISDSFMTQRRCWLP